MTQHLIRIRLAASRFAGFAAVFAVFGWSSSALALPVVRSNITNSNPPSAQDPVQSSESSMTNLAISIMQSSTNRRSK